MNGLDIFENIKNNKNHLSASLAIGDLKKCSANTGDKKYNINENINAVPHCIMNANSIEPFNLAYSFFS